jgi:hypothetical protein
MNQNFIHEVRAYYIREIHANILFRIFRLPVSFLKNTGDACALNSILPSLSLIDMIYCTADTKATPASVQGVGVDF